MSTKSDGVTTPVELLKELADKVHITRESWFNAQHRMDNHNRYSLWVITLLSIALVGLSIATGFKLKLPPLDEVSINVILTVLSVALLAYSCIVAKSDFALRGERFLRTGRELDHLERDINLCLAQSHGQPSDDLVKEIQGFSRRYTEALDATENHKELDYLRWKVRKGVEQKWKAALKARNAESTRVQPPNPPGSSSADVAAQSDEGISAERRDVWRNRSKLWWGIFLEYCLYWLISFLAMLVLALVAWGVWRAAIEHA